MEATIRSVEDIKCSENSDDNNNSFDRDFKKAVREQMKAKEFYEMANFTQAISIYRHTIFKLEKLHLSNSTEEEKEKALLIKSYLNLAICYNKIQMPKKACIAIQEMEKLTPIKTNPKALYAKAVAKMMLNDYVLARRYLQSVALLSPGDKKVKEAFKELDRLESDKAKYEEQNEALQMKMDLKTLNTEADKKVELLQRQKEDEARQNELFKFKTDLEASIISFKNNATVEYLKIDFDFHSLECINLAHEICDKYQIELKGIENNGNFHFYLKKMSTM